MPLSPIGKALPYTVFAREHSDRGNPNDWSTDNKKPSLPRFARNDVLYHASLSGKQIKNPFIQITHKGAKRQKLIPLSSITLSGSTGIISAVAITRRHPKRLNSDIVYSYSFDLSTILIKIYSCLRFTPLLRQCRTLSCLPYRGRWQQA